jgi:hypothetical protein
MKDYRCVARGACVTEITVIRACEEETEPPNLPKPGISMRQAARAILERVAAAGAMVDARRQKKRDVPLCAVADTDGANVLGETCAL